MWWNCFSSRSNTRPTGRKRRWQEDDEVGRATNSANHHAHITVAEVIDREPTGVMPPMPSEDVVNEMFTKIVVSCIRTSINLEHFVNDKWNTSSPNKSLHDSCMASHLCRMNWVSTKS